MEKVYIVSLGCSKNLVDSENILGLLESAGYRPVSSLDEAGTVIVNTCGFIRIAAEEAVETILEMVQRKEQGLVGRVFAVGCFVQRFGYKLLREIPEVDGWAGTGDVRRILDLVSAKASGTTPFLIQKPAFPVDQTTPRLLSGPGFSTYLKISDGCSHRCSFCMIPSLRGPLRSRSVDSLLNEAKALAAGGVRELNLVGQDTTAFGGDVDGATSLEGLLHALLKVETLEWIRILYSHPAGVTDGLLEMIASEARICSYLDIPFQHVASGVLTAMGRVCEPEYHPSSLLKRIRSAVNPISIRTTLMVGFPGETEGDFDELCAFVASEGLDHMGAFAFSPEKGVPASRLPGQVPQELREHRLDVLMRIQAGVSLKKKQALVGRVEPVLVEGLCTETDLLLVGRTEGMAPDVDGRVLINRGQARVGDIVPVRITEAHPYDLVGEVVDSQGSGRETQ